MGIDALLFSANKSENKNITTIPSKNCWIVYLMPFADKNDKHIYEYQQLCIENKIIGIGWRGGFDNNGNISSKKDAPPEYATKAIEEMEENDIVITRLRDGKYYVGKISSDIRFCMNNEDTKDADGFHKSRFSYIREVNKWLCFNEYELPSDITGRISQKRHKTIERIANDRLRLLLTDLYIKNANDKDFSHICIPKIRLNKNNFATSLNYMELEDLVYLYVNSQLNRKYVLYPSNCKTNKIKYEFFLHNPDTNETATCQVKNQAEIDVSKYTDDIENYSSIWLFSGTGYVHKNVKKTNSDGKEILNIIDKQKLFDFFIDKKNNACKHLRKKIESYYDFDNKDCDTKSIKFNNIKTVEIKNNSNIFFKAGRKKIDDFYYSYEFNSFIIKNDAYKNHKNTIDEIIDICNKEI